MQVDGDEGDRGAKIAEYGRQAREARERGDESQSEIGRIATECAAEFTGTPTRRGGIDPYYVRSQSHLWQERIAGRDFAGALLLLSSESRAAGLVHIAAEGDLSTEELAEVLRVAWCTCDAVADERDEILALFRKTGFVADCPAPVCQQSVTVYRGNLGEDPCLGISWTLRRDQAEWFAAYAAGSRGNVLGLSRLDGGVPAPTVWQGTADVADILGFFDGRGEAEVVIAPASIRDMVCLGPPLSAS